MGVRKRTAWSKKILQQLQRPSWINEQRIKLVSVVFIVLGVVTTIGLIVTSDGSLDQLGRPLGTDFSNVYSAGNMALDDRAAAAYTPIEQAQVQQALFGDPDVPFYGWHYPPFFLILAVALALLPYTVSWLTWMALTLPLYVVTSRRIIGKKTAILAAVGFPAVLVNFLHGQNGFLTAALMAGAMLSLRTKPVIAGILIALLAFKPQFGVLIPVVLLAGGYYRTFSAAAVSLIVMCGLATALFGVDIWLAFFESRHFSKHFILEAGSTGWHKIQSIFSAVRMWGGTIALAYAAQALLAIYLVVASLWIWRSKADDDLKAASLIVGSLLMTPYMLDYDMVALAPAMLFLLRNSLKCGFEPYERLGLAIIWFAPILTRPAGQFLSLPFGLLAMLVLFILILQKARRQTHPSRRKFPTDRARSALQPLPMK